ncbi:STAS domain-containing protein [Tropicimonas sp. IMCC34011]|uniref:STAS domain-containing protein n=1 Tax=Tropicimonas sp. IMCC34011 TaxID=2248759 RepID=UPI000E25B9E1|nr:STAS domain-containing protein [Tropicimonas sp. IMCC34011]
MLVSVEDLSLRLIHLRLRGTTLRMSAIEAIGRVCDEALARGVSAAIIDLSAMTGASASGTASLVELYGRYGDRLRLTFCGLGDKTRRHLQKAGLGGILPCHDDAASALADPPFRALQLCNHRAVILCGAGQPGPVPGGPPAPLLDIAGQPLLTHQLKHLARFGLGDVLIDAADPDKELPAHLHENPVPGQAQFFCSAVSAPRESGAVETLAGMATRHAAFGGDVVVVAGPILGGPDLGAMAAWHRQRGADVTVAAACLGGPRHGVRLVSDGAGRVTGIDPAANTARAETGIYIIRADILNRLGDIAGGGLATGLLPRLIASGGHVSAYTGAFRWRTIFSAEEYHGAMRAALEGNLPGILPASQRVRPGLWVAHGADISRRARLNGPCHVGAGAVIEAGADLHGPCVIGAGAVIGRNSRVSHSMVEAGTRLAEGSRLYRVLAGPTRHLDLTGTGRDRAPLPQEASPQDRGSWRTARRSA